MKIICKTMTQRISDAIISNRKMGEEIERMYDYLFDIEQDLDFYKSEHLAVINYISKEHPEVKEQLRLMRKKEDFYECYASRINMG